MWRSRKFIIAAVLAAVVLVGGIGGAVLAADDGDAGESETAIEAFLDRVCAIYQEKTGVAIDQEALKDAFDQAQSDMRTEALKTWLQSLVEEGKITQAQADEYSQWQQAKPDVPFGLGPHGRGGFGGHGGFRGMGGCFGSGRTGTPTQ